MVEAVHGITAYRGAPEGVGLPYVAGVHLLCRRSPNWTRSGGQQFAVRAGFLLRRGGECLASEASGEGGSAGADDRKAQKGATFQQMPPWAMRRYKTVRNYLPAQSNSLVFTFSGK